MEREDGKSLDDMHPPQPSSYVNRSSGFKAFKPTVPGSVVPKTQVPELSAYRHIASTESSGNITHSNTIETSREINQELQINILPNSLLRGVKRKFVGSHYEVKKRKRQKTYHYTPTVQIIGKKRKLDDDSDHFRKCVKTSSENSHSNVEVPNIEHETENGNEADNTASCSEPTAQSGETSGTIDKDDEGDEEMQACSSTCVCQAGLGELPLEIERKFDTAEPLYRACLQCRIFSLTNTQYMCCKNRCIKKYFRVKVMEKYLCHMNEDYYRSDLSVHEYSWGEWKE